MNTMQEINKELSTFFNNLLVNNSWVEDIIFLFADLPIFIIPLFLVGFRLYYNYKEINYGKKILILIFLSTVIAILISILIQQFVILERPEEHLKNTGKLILEHIPDASFPSDHASVSIAFLTSLFLFGFRKIASIILPLFLIMNISRIIAGVHWPFDILAGFMVGILSGVIIFSLKNNNYLNKLNSYIIKIMNFIKL